MMPRGAERTGVPRAGGAEWSFLAGVLARGLVGRCARILAERGIAAMALKGAALHALVYEDPGERPLSDVDLLVHPREHARAIDALVAAGFERHPESTPWATALKAPDVALSVDLHAHLFRPGLYGLSADGLFARAHLDDRTFGVPVWLPGDYDLYAHCVGHFAKTRMDARNPRAALDLERIASTRGLDPRRCARHLEAEGLGRAARYTIDALGGPDDFGRAVRSALAPDPTGDLLSAAARRIARACPQPSAFSAPAAHLVNRSLGAGVLTLGAHALGSARRSRP